MKMYFKLESNITLLMVDGTETFEKIIQLKLQLVNGRLHKKQNTFL